MSRQPLLEPADSSSTAQAIARCALGAMLIFAGISHLTFARREFTAQVPQSLPLDDDTVVTLSGVAEIAIGSSLIVLPKHRIPMGLGTAAFFIAVFPGNISQYLTRRSAFGLDTDRKRFARLFGQPLLVAWALRSTGAWNWLMGREEAQALDR